MDIFALIIHLIDVSSFSMFKEKQKDYCLLKMSRTIKTFSISSPPSRFFHFSLSQNRSVLRQEIFNHKVAESFRFNIVVSKVFAAHNFFKDSYATSRIAIFKFQ